MQRCLLRNHLGMPYSARRVSKRDQLTEGLGDDVGNLLNISFGELASAFRGVHLSDPEREQSESAAETLDDAEAEGGLLLTIDIGVLHTNDVLEISGVLKNQS